MMQAAQGSLTILNAHTSAPSVYWNGKEVVGIERIHIQNDEDEARVKLIVSDCADEVICADMILAGVAVRKAK